MRIRDWSSDVCSSDLALGADDVARAFEAAGCEGVRTGSRGLFSIEPLVEVESAGKRIGFGPVGPEDVAAVLDGSHKARLGDVAALPFFAGQQRFTFARCGIIDPPSLPDRTSVVEGTRVSVRGDIGGRRLIKKKN